MWDCFIQEICCFISFSSLLRPLSVRRTAGQRHSSHMQLFVTPHRPRRCFLFHMYNVYCCNLIMNLSMWWWGGRKCLVSRIFFVFDGGAWKKQVKYSKVMFEVKGQGQPVGQQASLSSSQGVFYRVFQASSLLWPQLARPSDSSLGPSCYASMLTLTRYPKVRRHTVLMLYSCLKKVYLTHF